MIRILISNLILFADALNTAVVLVLGVPTRINDLLRNAHKVLQRLLTRVDAPVLLCLELRLGSIAPQTRGELHRREMQPRLALIDYVLDLQRQRDDG